MNEAALDQVEHDGSQVVIERAKPEDAEAIFAVKYAAMLDGYADEALGITVAALRRKVVGRNGELTPSRIEKIRQMIAEEEVGSGATFVARQEGRIAGYVTARQKDGEPRISFLFVDPLRQGQGLGGRLLDEALEWWGSDQDVYLVVRDYNHKAIEMYQRRGFEIVPDDSPDPDPSRGYRNVKMVHRATTT